MHINAVVKDLKGNGQDFEFYPTTDEIIQKVKARIEDRDSVLDCGAGDGTTLSKLTDGDKYAIEKSSILQKLMPSDVFIVGCDFHENSLIDKKVDVVFCNPPYTEFVNWATRIITEAAAKEVFLVLPQRWSTNPRIAEALSDRGATATVIHSTDFLDAERQARAKVDVIQVTLRNSTWSTELKVDPFILWAEKEFPLQESVDTPEGTFKERVSEIVPGEGYISALVNLYQDELATLQANFKSISQLDPTIFSELKVDFKSILGFLKLRIEGLKSKYWHEVFDRFEPLTTRLTKKSRENMLGTLTKNVSVDFVETNILAVVAWAVKNANKYFDSQLVDVFKDLAERANIVRYKSNKQTWGDDGWRFKQDLKSGDVKHFGLDYRCVITCYTTFSKSDYERYDFQNGLHNRVHDKLNDIMTVARNLGFVKPDAQKSEDKVWVPGKQVNFYMSENSEAVLMAVKAYKNGNLHIKFNKKFLRQLNVEFGRLVGWLRDHKQASDELNIPELDAKRYFKSNLCLGSDYVPLLDC